MEATHSAFGISIGSRKLVWSCYGDMPIIPYDKAVMFDVTACTWFAA
jgi:hypothetical protein